MKSARLAHWLRNDRLAAAVAMALGVTAGAASVFAQGIIAIGPPSFQSNDYPSLSPTSSQGFLKVVSTSPRTSPSSRG